MIKHKYRRPAPGNEQAIRELIEKKSKNQEVNNLAVWIPAAAAIIWFYDWVFEYALCYRLKIPVYLIQPTIANVLHYVFIFAITVMIVVGVYIFSLYANWKMMLFSFLGLIGIVDTFVYLSFSSISPNDFLFFTVATGLIWLLLAIFGAMIKNDITASFAKSWRRNFLVYSVISLCMTAYFGYEMPTFSPPDTLIVGKEPLVIVNRYGDEIICRYLDSCPKMYLINKIKVFKLDGSNSFTTIRLDPAPALELPDSLLKKIRNCHIKNF